MSSTCAGEGLANTALIIVASDAGQDVGNAVEFWPDITRSSFKPVESLPVPRFSHSAADLGSLVYTCGGTTGWMEYHDDCYVVDVTVGGAWQAASAITNKEELFSIVSMRFLTVSCGNQNAFGNMI